LAYVGHDVYPSSVGLIAVYENSIAVTKSPVNRFFKKILLRGNKVL